MRQKGSYKKWTKEERNFSYELTKMAEARGWIKPRKKCGRCGQQEGIIHLHNEDYDVTIKVLSDVFLNIPDGQEPVITPEQKAEIDKVLEILCWRCHMIHHSAYRNPAACEKYWDEIKSGKMYPPVFKHNFAVLKENNL